MKHLNAEFVLSAAKKEHFPELNLPEIAFAGRSNVGKSSLLNSLVLRKKLAFISSTPGKTQLINFFNINGKWIFADLPGFGYAVVSKTKRHEWKKLNSSYLENRKNLKLVCALIDSRHDPMESDLAFIEWMELNEIPFIIILTKSDKIPKKQVVERKEQIEHLVCACDYCVEVLPYSSVKGIGREQLLAVIKKRAVLSFKF